MKKVKIASCVLKRHFQAAGMDKRVLRDSLDTEESIEEAKERRKEGGQESVGCKNFSYK